MKARAGDALGWSDLDVRWTRVAGAVLAGSLALGAAVGLTATSAWLIARAAELPSPADLAIAAVLVRTFGVSRAILRYVERLSSHDTALRGVTTLRTRVYERLAGGEPARVLGLGRGDIVARAGADLDAVGDAVVKALVPVGVAAVVSLASIGIVASQHLGAAACLAAGLLVAATLPPLLTARSVRLAQGEGVEAEGEVAVAALAAIEGSTESRVWGTTAEALARVELADERLARSRDAAARPSAFAAGILVALQGATLVGTVAIAISAVAAGDLTGPAAAIVALTPLAAFEAVSAVAPAAAQAQRSRAAVGRVNDLVAAAGIRANPEADDEHDPTRPAESGPATLELVDVSAAWPGATPTRPVSLVLRPGSVVGIVGPSGVGKTTLLLTLAGALPPVAGQVLLNGVPVTPGDTGTCVAMTAEDAHIFGTTILENLRVARGDVTPGEAGRALGIVGLTPWLARQRAGLDSPLGSGGLGVSGGERRRLLLARALLHPAPIHLIDEPAEHLDEAGVDVVRAIVAEVRGSGRSIIVVTHDRSLLDVVDTVVDLG